jgi:hypothetical protein
MKKETSPAKMSPGGCRGTGGVLSVALSFLAVWVLGRVSRAQSGQTVTLADLSRTREISVHAPAAPFRTGALYVLYEGDITADAALEVVSNRGRDRAVIPLRAGKAGGVYGGAEHWVDDLSVRFVPCGAPRGALKITAVCGRDFTRGEREWFLGLHGRK